MGNQNKKQQNKLINEIITDYDNHGTLSTSKLQELWRKADKDKSGYLDKGEAKQFFGNLYSTLKTRDVLREPGTKSFCVEKWIQRFDKNGNGMLSQDEFMASLYKILELEVRRKDKSINEIKAILLGAFPCEIKRYVHAYMNNEDPGPLITDFEDKDTKIDENVTMSITIGPTLLPIGDMNDEHDRFRSLCYVLVDYALIIYSVALPWTLQTIDLYVSEIQQYAPGTPYFLVGVHSEAREGKEVSVSCEEGKMIAERIGAVMYYEMSLVGLRGVRDCFMGSLELWKKLAKK